MRAAAVASMTLALLLVASGGSAQLVQRQDAGAEPVAPESAAEAGLGAESEVRGFAPWFVRNVDRLVEQAIADSTSPGVAVVVGFGGEVVFSRGYGRTDWAEDAPAADDRTVWDLASVTKVVATTLAAMVLVEEGRFDLDAPLAAYLPSWPMEGTPGRVTPRHLLNHTAGLPTGTAVWRFGDTLEERVGGILRVGLHSAPGMEERYSDLGPILMGFVVEAVTGEDLEFFVEERIYRRLGLAEMGFRPTEAGVPPRRIAPTERIKGTHLHGVVHDPNARFMGGVAGNAGVFASAADLATLAGALLWEQPGRVVCRDVLRAFTTRPGTASRFGAGWEMPAHWAVWSESLSDQAFGHTGYTGTSLWIDPVQDLFVVLLTSRVNPSAANRRHLRLRRDLHQLVGRASLHLEEEERAADWRIPEVWRGGDSCRAEAGFAALVGMPLWIHGLL